METTRESLNLVVVGHVDHGKSTIIGRLLYDTHSLPQGAIDKVRRIAGETGKAFEFAYLLDAFEEEQKQGITIDTTQLRFRTIKRDYVIIDAPGHKEFLKNMISGATQAEAAFLVVDASRGVEEQSRRHARMLSLLGIRQIYVLVNKMDLVDYSREVYGQIRREMEAFLTSIGLAAGGYIPLSALLGENVLRASEKLPWHSGHSLVQALDALDKAPDAREGPLRFPVQDVYKFDDRRIIAGRVESGRLKAGDRIAIYPGGRETTVRSLASWPEKDRRSVALAGESIGIILADEFFNQRGEVVSHAATPPFVTRAFRASIFWMGKNPLRPGRKYKLKIATQAVEAEVTEIVRVLDASSLVPEGPRAGESENLEVRLNDVAEVVFTAGEAVVLDAFAVSPSIGRFVLVEGYDVVGGGIVIRALDEAEVFCGFVLGDLRARCELFKEYYYSVEDYAVSSRPGKGIVYTVGDLVPLEGRSFSFPEFFDVVVLRDQVAARVREGRITAILPLEDYSYAGFPLVNGRGFALKVRSRADWRRCLAEYAAIGRPEEEAVFSGKWLEFAAYRSIPFASHNWEI